MDALGDDFRWQFLNSVVQQWIQYMHQSAVALRRNPHFSCVRGDSSTGSRES